MQLCFCDIGTLLIAGIELFYINYSQWIGHIELCPIYLGIESFACTATYYFIIAINLHGLSTWNLTMKTLEKDLYLQQQESDNDDYNYTDSDLDDDDEDDDEQTQSDDLNKVDKGGNNSNNNNNDNYEIALSHRGRSRRQRSLTIDYRKRKLNISVMLPVIFIWFLAASVSVPLFVFGNVLPNNEHPKLCGIINFDQDNNFLMQLLIVIIRIGLPSVLFLLTFTFVIHKLYFTKIRLHQCVGGAGGGGGGSLDENALAILQLSFIISITFLIFSIQHIYGSLLFEILSKPFGQYKYPKFNRFYSLILSMIHYFLSCLRPFIYFYYDKNIRDETKLIFCKLKLMQKKIDVQVVDDS